jgi:oxygen-dependent protoporphyrinogen oxidase
MTVAVIGAGLAGLSAAWELVQAGVDVTVLEGERHAGGVVVTEQCRGFVVEGGPDGFLAADSDIQQLARELGLGDRLVDQQARGSQLWTGQRLEPLADAQAAALLGIQGPSDQALDRGFRTFAGGMAEITAALIVRLAPALRTAQGVTGLAPGPRGWRLSVTGGAQLEVEGVVLAVPAWAAARLVAAVGVPEARALGAVVYSPCITVSLAYRSEQFAATPQGAGFVSAPGTGGAVRACTYAWRKYPGRAPDDGALVRAFVGPVDGDPATLAQAELAEILDVRGAPLWSRTFHWTRGLPRYPPDHAAHVAVVRERLRRLAPLDCAGAGFDGAGVSACVKSGREAARRVISRPGAPARA